MSEQRLEAMPGVVVERVSLRLNNAGRSQAVSS